MYDQDLLVDELRKLVGWGAKPHRLPTLFTLRIALGVADGLSHAQAGRKMQRLLLARIRALSGSYMIHGHMVEALQVRLALQVLLRYDRFDDDAPTRRTAAMRHLGIVVSVESWRRAHGPEAELLMILAESLMMPVAA